MHRNAMVLAMNERIGSSENLILSIIIPVYNEAEVLEKQTLKLVAYVQRLTEKFEVLFVENGSKDDTLTVLRKLQKRFNFIRVKRLEKADYSTAVIEGVKVAKGKYSIVTGIDYVDLAVLQRCMRTLRSSDVVICSKNRGSDGRPLLNRLANRCYNAFVRLFFGLKYSDVEGYHGYDTRKVQNLIADVETKAHLGNLWILVKARRAGLRIDEVPLFVYEQRRSRFMTFTRLPYLAAISFIEFIKLKCQGY